MPKLIDVLAKVKLSKRSDGWWVVNLPWEDCQEYGPYDTKAEAEKARQGAFDFYRNADRPGFISAEKHRPMDRKLIRELALRETTHQMSIAPVAPVDPLGDDLDLG